MAYAAPRRCTCGNLVQFGSKCDCQVRRDAERKARHDRMRLNARDRGYNTRWNSARAGWLLKHPRCAKCGAKATVVDHIKPHRGDKQLFWDKGNWQSLCAHCHSKHKQAKEAENLLAHPFIDRPPCIPTIVVAGPPGSGKRTYVSEHAGPDDLVLDLVSIKAKLGNCGLYDVEGEPFTAKALRLRNEALKAIAKPNRYRRCWFITADPDYETWARKLNARLVIMPTCAAECVARIKGDPRRMHCRDKHIELVAQWFAKRSASQ